jgi:hypothetical protein
LVDWTHLQETVFVPNAHAAGKATEKATATAQIKVLISYGMLHYFQNNEQL